MVGAHARAFSRGGTVYNPRRYVPVLARKPGALRNGAPFKHWVLPAAIERVRRKLRAAPDGDRQMVEILGAVLSDGLPAVEAACAEALREGVHPADVILNILFRMCSAALTVRGAASSRCSIVMIMVLSAQSGCGMAQASWRPNASRMVAKLSAQGKDRADSSAVNASSRSPARLTSYDVISSAV